MTAEEELKKQNGIQTPQKPSADGMASGMKTTQTVTQKQQMNSQGVAPPSGQLTYNDKSAEQRNMETAQAMMQGKEIPDNPPKPQQKDASSAEAASEKRNLSYTDMFKMLSQGEEESPEQKARRERRERQKAVIASISDGLSAIANMVSTAHGAQSTHDPRQDLTANYIKRRERLKAEREKNHSAYLNGYLKAQALDEEARKNDATLAEQIRYHNQLAQNRDRVGDQKDRSLDQKDRSLDLTAWKYTTDADYKNKILEIRQAEADGKLSHQRAMEGIALLRERRVASKTSSSSKGNTSNAGYWYEYYDMMDSPEGQKRIGKIMNQIGARKVTATNVRWIMDRAKGRHSATAAPGTGNKSQQRGASTPAKKPTGGKGSSPKGKKKPTGVKW